jgi:hypothetical protein
MYVTVAEDAEHGRNQAASRAVVFAVLDLQILHQRLRHRQAKRFSVMRVTHAVPLS